MKKVAFLLLLSMMVLGSCRSTTETKVNMPVYNSGAETGEIVETTTSEIIEDDPVDTKFDVPEPKVEYKLDDLNVCDGFSTISASDVSFIAIKVSDDKYAIYTINGVELDSFHIVDGGSELLAIYDYSEIPVIRCIGDIEFVSGGIMGLNRVPNITRISNRLPVDMNAVIDNCVWMKDFDRNAKNKIGIWKSDVNGRTYIITYIYDYDVQTKGYYMSVSDQTLSLYPEWNDLLVKFK